MNKDRRSNIDRVVEEAMCNGAHKAIMYLAPNRVIRATRRLLRGKVNRRERDTTIILTLGRPNYAERKYIKRHLLAKGKPFISLIQVKFPPQRKRRR